MNPGNGVDLAALMNPQPRQPQMVLATPLNDVQVLGLMAAHQTDKTPLDAAQWAVDTLVACKKVMSDPETLRAFAEAGR